MGLKSNSFLYFTMVSCQIMFPILFYIFGFPCIIVHFFKNMDLFKTKFYVTILCIDLMFALSLKIFTCPQLYFYYFKRNMPIVTYFNYVSSSLLFKSYYIKMFHFANAFYYFAKSVCIYFLPHLGHFKTIVHLLIFLTLLLCQFIP